MSVSIVAAPWRRLIHAARWNGHAPQTTTGEARVEASHCQLVNCSAGTIASSSTGSGQHRGHDEPIARGAVLAAARVLDRHLRAGDRGRGARRRRAGPVARRLHDGHEIGGGDGRRTCHRRLLGGVVHRCGDALDLVQALLDASRARRARHPVDVELVEDEVIHLGTGHDRRSSRVRRQCPQRMPSTE